MKKLFLFLFLIGFGTQSICGMEQKPTELPKEDIFKCIENLKEKASKYKDPDRINKLIKTFTTALKLLEKKEKENTN
jgi:hypothetical protein